MTVDIEAVTAILREVAAEEVMPRFRSLAEHEVRAKDGGELVTVADIAAERQITRRLRDLLPGSQVVGEEATAEDPGLLDTFAQEDGWIWVIDPIDGTSNFAGGRPVFALMVAPGAPGRDHGRLDSRSCRDRAAPPPSAAPGLGSMARA